MCLATGPSLTREDVEACRGKARVIAVNDAYRLAPWAEAMVAADPSWWHAHEGASEFPGEQWSIEHGAWKRYRDRWPRIQRLRRTGDRGLETNPAALKTGKNSGYLALGLAVHYGAAQIVLLGYDMSVEPNQKKHFFGDHPGAMNQSSPYHLFLDHYQTLVAPLKAFGVQIVNCSRRTALTCFPRAPLEAVL